MILKQVLARGKYRALKNVISKNRGPGPASPPP